jgi:hypothetical protein
MSEDNKRNIRDKIKLLKLATQTSGHNRDGHATSREHRAPALQISPIHGEI